MVLKQKDIRPVQETKKNSNLTLSKTLKFIKNCHTCFLLENSILTSTHNKSLIFSRNKKTIVKKLLTKLKLGVRCHFKSFFQWQISHDSSLTKKILLEQLYNERVDEK